MRILLLVVVMVGISALSGWASTIGQDGEDYSSAYPMLTNPWGIPLPSQIPIRRGVWTGAKHCRDFSLMKCGYWRGMYRFYTGHLDHEITLYGVGRP